jgi:hypothetical protein
MSCHPDTASARVRRIALYALLGLGATPVSADPAAYVFTPYADVGAWLVAYGLGSARARDGSRESQQTLSLGGTPTSRWTTSVYAAWVASDGGAYGPDEWTWFNHAQLTTPGAGPVDVGALCELARPHARDEGRFAFSCGPTLQMDTDDLQLELNLSLGRHVGAAGPAPLALGYQWEARTMVARGVELGAQGFGSLGPWNDWAPASRQEHTLGPAIFLKTTALGGPIRLDAAVLFGVGAGSPRSVWRSRLQHAF